MRLLVSILLWLPFVGISQPYTLSDPAFLGAAAAKPAVGPVTAIQTITTSTNATPSITNLTIATGNAIRVWTGETPVAEGGFNLYYRINGGTVQTVRMYRWQGRILYAAVGNAISLGTDDGRSVQVAQMTVPASLISPTGTNGNVNCDRAGPPLWTPTAAHIVLPTVTNAFTIDSTNSERVVFISEYDGATWSWPRWIWVQTNYSVRVQCTYSNIAMANYDGVGVGITAPAGTQLGGTSGTMTLNIPTGTTLDVTTSTELTNAIATAVSGNDIVLANGTYILSNKITAASFVANIASGRVGGSGVTMRGTTANASNVVIQFLQTLDSGYGGFNLTNNDATNYQNFKNLTISTTNSTQGFSVLGGKWRFENVIFRGDPTNAGNIVGFNSTDSDSITLDMLHCQASHACRDNLSADVVGAGNEAASRLRFIDCSSYIAGTNSTDQCITTHKTLLVEIYGGHYYDAQVNTIASDGTPMHVFFANSEMGSRKGGISSAHIFGSWASTDTGTFTVLTNSTAQFSRFILTNQGATTAAFRQAGIFELSHNRLYSLAGTGRGNTALGTGNIIGNLFDDFSSACLLSGAYTNTLLNNTYNSAASAINISDTSITAHLTNNAAKGSVNGTTVATGGMANVTTDYNTWDPTIDADYVAGPNDIVNADAALSADYIPTASGNCDSNGLDVYGWVGDSDYFGFVWIYKNTRISRGARDIPAIYSSAVLFPDFY